MGNVAVLSLHSAQLLEGVQRTGVEGSEERLPEGLEAQCSEAIS